MACSPRPRIAPLLAAACFGAAALAGVALAAGDEEPVDLELVLAVDASSSVSGPEFDLQMHGLAEAFRHPAVAAAIQASGELGIAVSLVQWADSRKQFVAVDWMLVRDAAAALELADTIDATPRFLIGGGTAVGAALGYCLRVLEDSGYAGRRKVIDISGDGRTNQGVRPNVVRDVAVAQGVTINGLAILNEDPYMDGYYLYHVIGGTGSFVMSANNYEDYAAAMLEKLLKEISGAPLVMAPGEAPGGRGQLAERPPPTRAPR